ncbi:NADH-quinone oxidoreductase subunit L, partial [Klebsiella pneumoniae]|nr:NADH-quinone oxidoreductase subunit L [Klebsiella pneumoniae]
GAALAALPLITAGFYSKDEILWGAVVQGQNPLFIAGLVGAFMTSLYTFRMIFIVFHGKEHTQAHAVKGFTHTFPLLVLMVLSTAAGAFIPQPLHGVFPAETLTGSADGKLTTEIISGVVAVAGIVLAAMLWLGRRT